MIARYLVGLGISLLAVAMLAGVVTVLPINPYPEIPGAQKISQATYCRTQNSLCLPDSAAETVALPHHMKPQITSGLHGARFTFHFDRPGSAGEVTALFLPRYSDFIALRVNGSVVTPNWPDGETGPLFHRWHRPYFTTLPRDILTPTGNRVDVDLKGYFFSNLSLYPVYVGDAAVLDYAHEIALIQQVGMARVNFALMLLAGTALVFLWAARREDVTYLWLAAANFSAAIVSYHWVFPNLLADYRTWILVWNLLAGFLAWFLLGFVAALTGARVRWFQLVTLAALVAISGVLMLLPESLFALGLQTAQVAFIGLALAVLCVLIANRRGTGRANVAVLFTLYAMIVALIAVHWVSWIAPSDRVAMQTLPLIPVAYFLSLLWIIFYQLASALHGYEDLTANLQKTIAEKSEELRVSYAQLAAQAEQEAIGEERQRILLDLHDGLGGQLVNTLAYMASQPEQDAVLQAALEDALNDMGLMIDSLEATDSIATQLGMLRARLSPLLDKHSITLNWAIAEEPVLPEAGPSQNLTLLRIVQEAITNAIKHSSAAHIWVTTARNSISVRDDGHGFDADQSATSRASSGKTGLIGMNRRARSIPVELEITSDDDGSRVVVSW